MKKPSKKKVKDRRKVGIVKAYISRAAAIKKLQIPLADFRRLCILKGVYPVEPKNKSKLTGGNTRRKTYFFTRDIQYLINEPLLYKFWEFKVFMKRLTRAQGRHDFEKFKQVNENKPFYKLDTVVKERYPRFVDALRDCDDALSMCFLFAMFPKGKGRPDDLIDLSRKLTLEFMQYVIASKSLRKVFISIKGYYYQADIMNQTVTWIVPHQFVIDRVTNVDLNVMKTFTEFYVTLLGFINYKLYKTLNAAYPPQLISDSAQDLVKRENVSKIQRKRKLCASDDEDEEVDQADTREEAITTLNKKIRLMENKSVANAEIEGQQIDVFDEEKDIDKEKDDKGTVQEVLALERLFEGLKFFLNRESPRESLVFVLRSFGGEVIFDESDSTITHQIIDRDILSERRVDRVYVQPQWVYDSINMRTLLPTSEYLMGAKLPPHLSPFVNEKKGDYVPPDKTKLLNLRKAFEAENKAEEAKQSGEQEQEEDEESEVETVKEPKPPRLRRDKSKMIVRRGRLTKEDKEQAQKDEDSEYRRMGIMMIPKKKKRLFDKITRTQKQKSAKVQKLQAKRRIVDAVAGRKSKRVR